MPNPNARPALALGWFFAAVALVFEVSVLVTQDDEGCSEKSDAAGVLMISVPFLAVGAGIALGLAGRWDPALRSTWLRRSGTIVAAGVALTAWPAFLYAFWTGCV